MGMISGPYTDTVVKMLMSEDHSFCDGAILKNVRGIYGFLYHHEVWIADPCVRSVSESEFDVKRSISLRFPEPYADTFRFTEGDGNIFLPEYKEKDKKFLHQCGYSPASPKQTMERLLAEKGNPHHILYPFSCKTGVWAEEDAKEVARILIHLYD